MLACGSRCVQNRCAKPISLIFPFGFRFHRWWPLNTSTHRIAENRKECQRRRRRHQWRMVNSTNGRRAMAENTISSAFSSFQLLSSTHMSLRYLFRKEREEWNRKHPTLKTQALAPTDLQVQFGELPWDETTKDGKAATLNLRESFVSPGMHSKNACIEPRKCRFDF